MKDYTKLNLDPHKEARFAMWFYHDLYAETGLGSMKFYETYLSDRDRAMCVEAIKDITDSRNKGQAEK